MSQLKAISPIIAIIIILLITIAIAGAGYSYISTYWAGLIGKEIQVVSSFCAGEGQAKVMVKNIGTNPLRTGEITVINPNTGEDLTQDVSWAPSVSDPNLVLELKFEEGSGTTAKDTSGQGNDGTLLPSGSGPGWTADGRIGGGLSFDGVDDYVDCGNGASLNIINAITIAAWVYRDSYSAGAQYHVVVSKLHTAYELYFMSGSLTFQANRVGDLRAVAQGGAPSGGWHHAVFRFDKDNQDSYGSYHSLYLDGTIMPLTWINGADTNTPLNANSASVYVGGRGGSLLFNGLIDEVRIYNRALSPEEIAILAGNFQVQPGETATFTHTCTGRCRYNLVLGGTAKEAMLEC